MDILSVRNIPAKRCIFFVTGLLIISAHLYAAANQQGTAIVDDYHQRHFGGICDLTIHPAFEKRQQNLRSKWPSFAQVAEDDALSYQPPAEE